MSSTTQTVENTPQDFSINSPHLLQKLDPSFMTPPRALPLQHIV